MIKMRPKRLYSPAGALTGGGGGGTWVQIGTDTTISNDASVNFTDLTTYTTYLIRGFNVIGVGSTTLLMRMLTSTTPLTSGVYQYHLNYSYQSSNSYAGLSSGSATSWQIGNEVMGDWSTDNTRCGANFEIYVTRLNQGRRPQVWWHGVAFGVSPSLRTLQGVGMLNSSTTSYDGVQLLMGSGNMDRGTLQLFGRA